MKKAWFDLIYKDYSNPQTAGLLRFYPEETSGPVSEAWQATRWRKLLPDLLTPMYCQGLKNFYVNKLADLSSGEYIIPKMWIVRNKQLCANAHPVVVTEVSTIL